MKQNRRIVGAFWMGAMVMSALVFFLPGRAERCFLSWRAYRHEQLAVSARKEERPGMLRFLPRLTDDGQVAERLLSAARAESRGLTGYVALLVLALNLSAWFLYMFGLSGRHLALWLLAWCVTVGVIVARAWLLVP